MALAPQAALRRRRLSRALQHASNTQQTTNIQTPNSPSSSSAAAPTPTTLPPTTSSTTRSVRGFGLGIGVSSGAKRHACTPVYVQAWLRAVERWNRTQQHTIQHGSNTQCNTQLKTHDNTQTTHNYNKKHYTLRTSTPPTGSNQFDQQLQAFKPFTCAQALVQHGAQGCL